MNEFCLNCEHLVVANQHGRCPICDSQALAPAEDLMPFWLRKLQREAEQAEPNYTEEHEIDELRRLYDL